MAGKITAPAVMARKGGEKIKMVTAYDAPTARIADRAGSDIILVGDSVGNVVLGRADTLSVTVDDIIHHTAAVASVSPRALIVGDMPWLSYHSSVEETVANAGRLVREGGAESVKIEGGRKRMPDDPGAARRRDPRDGPPRPHSAVGARHGRLQGAGPETRRWPTR